MLAYAADAAAPSLIHPEQGGTCSWRGLTGRRTGLKMTINEEIIDLRSDRSIDEYMPRDFNIRR